MCCGVLALLLLVGGCRRAEPVRVVADPALKGALDELAPLFREQYAGGWNVQYQESAAIQQLPADDFPHVVLTVEPVAQHLLKGGLVEESTMRTFAGDLLTVVTPRSRPLGLAKVGDLVITLFKGIGVGDKGTSVGYYATQALIADGAQGKIKEQLKEYSSLAEIVEAVGSASIDFGMVYASTAAQNKELAVAMTIPEDLYQDIRYSAVASKAAAQKSGVVELLKFLAEDEKTQQILGSYGYLDRKTAMDETK